MKIYEHLIIDMNNLYWRQIEGRDKKTVQYKNNILTTSGIEGCIDYINKFERIYLKEGSESKIWLLFDNPDSVTNLRKDIDPDYKSKRDRMSSDMAMGLQYLTELLKIYNDDFNILFSEKMEADDLVKPIIGKIGKDKKVLMITTDMDWSRSITDNVHWYNWDKLIDMDVFSKMYNFIPCENSIQLFKSFSGDKTDSIPNPFYNVSRGINWKLPKKKLNYIIKKSFDIIDFYSKLDDELLDFDDKWKKRFREVKSRILLNYQLVSFQIPIDFNLDNIIIQSKFSKVKCRFWFDIFDFEHEYRFEKKEEMFSFLDGEKPKRI